MAYLESQDLDVQQRLSLGCTQVLTRMEQQNFSSGLLGNVNQHVFRMILQFLDKTNLPAICLTSKLNRSIAESLLYREVG